MVVSPNTGSDIPHVLILSTASYTFRKTIPFYSQNVRLAGTIHVREVKKSCPCQEYKPWVVTLILEIS
jgi:hypothetical protein